MAGSSPLQLTSLFLPDVDLKGLGASDFEIVSPTAQVAPDPGALASLVLTLDHPVDVMGTGETTTLAFPAGATFDNVYLMGDTATGAYHVISATLTDTSGNTTTYNAAALAAAGVSTGFTVGDSATGGDQERPELTSFSPPANIVTSAAGASATFGISGVDVGGSGIASATVELDKPLQTPNGPVSTLTFGGSTGDFTYGAGSSTVDVTSATASGVYHVTAVTLTDAAGNTRSYDAADVASLASFTVDDKTAPVLTSLHLPTVDVTSSDANLDLSATVSDAANNAASITLTLDKPIVEQGYQGHGVSDTDPTSTLTLSPVYDPTGADPGGFADTYATVDTTTKAGVYTVTQAVVTDQAGNSTTYATADLAKLGFDTTLTVKADSIPPVLTSLTLPSFTAGGSSSGTISVGATDAGATDSSILAVVNLDHPLANSGNAGVYLNQPALPLLSGPSTGFETGTTGEATVTADATQSPSYNVTGVALIDRAGNETDYSAAQLQQMGFSTHFVTNSAALFTAAPGGETLVAPVSGAAWFQGDGGGASTVVLNGNVGDYTLSRLQPTSGVGSGASQVGAFVLTATNGSGSYTIEQSVAAVRFQDGQYLSLQDLPAYVHGSAALAFGGDGHDILYQNPSEAYQLFVGGGGSDDLYLNGNVRDYTLRPFEADTAAVPSADLSAGHASGLELVAKNGTGALLIDSSVETIHFKDGQYLSYGDLGAYVAADPQHATDPLAITPDGAGSAYQDVSAAEAGDRVLLNGNVSDYALSRPVSDGGDFVLSGSGTSTVVLPQTIASVQFANGQYLAPQDLGAYVSGSDVFTSGTSGNDILQVPTSGDQYVVGGAGFDNLYLHGNTRDYTLQAVDQGYDPSTGHPAIDGYELVADNGSGDIYIDGSVEVVHFQNGQYLAFHDLPAYIEPFHA